MLANPNTYNEDSIDYNYVATIIAPETGPARRPGMGCGTSMAHAKRLYEVFTDDSGNAMYMFFPYAIAAPYGGVRSQAAQYIRVANYAYALFNGPEGTNPDFAGGAQFVPETGYYVYTQDGTIAGGNNGISLYTTKGIHCADGPLWRTSNSVEEYSAGP